ncbi:hypothetical protein KDU71_00185 [Carboxylicivirga sediminis]|uniref:histidine kinase n=1 Tax=Carboxylicivirga sediminis TaxID=2006564 RepID=A0A941EZE3_9BACT|nr:histidine kinase [Carboxylicivirga sediminis]MBR8533962.1 hypothetical protein [Carboxylicivirga sediminis]
MDGLDTGFTLLHELVLFSSVLIQVTAASIATGLIPKTRYSIAWIAISLGFLLMAVRLLVNMVDYLFNSSYTIYDVSNVWLALIISITMLVASVYIRRILKDLEELSIKQTKTEEKVIAAMVITEEKEKKRIAQEIHDGLGPVLSITRMLLSTVKTEKLDEEQLSKLKSVNDSLAQGVLSVYEISNQLRPLALNQASVLEAMRSFVRRSGVKNLLNIKFHTNISDEKYDFNIEIVLYRVFCELLNNTIKHANASKASVSLYKTPEMLVFIYTDDGCGFDAEQDFGKGMGLLNIASRAKAIGAGLVVENTSSGGMFVNIDVPLVSCLNKV